MAPSAGAACEAPGCSLSLLMLCMVLLWTPRATQATGLFSTLIRMNSTSNHTLSNTPPLSVSLCLQDQGLPCSLDTPCPAQPPPRDCLLTPIRAWGAPYRRMACCFRCCLQHYLREHKLARNYRFHIAKLRHCSYNPQSVPDLDSILLGYNTVPAFADMVMWWRQPFCAFTFGKYAAGPAVRSGIVVFQGMITSYVKEVTLCLLPHIKGNLSLIQQHGQFPYLRPGQSPKWHTEIMRPYPYLYSIPRPYPKHPMSAGWQGQAGRGTNISGTNISPAGDRGDVGD